MPEETWETEEVIRWLINDEEAYNQLSNASASEIERYVVTDHLAPAGLYDSFNAPPPSTWKSVDWDSVAEALAGE